MDEHPAQTDQPPAATPAAPPSLDVGETVAAPSGRWRPAIAGVLAAGVALGVGELLSGLSSRVPSLVARVGDIVIDNVPGSIERWAIETLGENDKPALIIGITVIALLIGAWTGIAASRNFNRGLVVFAAFGLIGALAASSDPQRPALSGWLVAAAAALAGIATLALLLRLATPREHAPSVFVEPAATEPSDRRSFVGAAGAAAAFGVAAPLIGTALRGRQNAAVEADRDAVAASLDRREEPTTGPTSEPEPAPQLSEQERAETMEGGGGTQDPQGEANFDAIDGITPIVVPNDEFYRIDTALVVPRIDVDTWSMKITGMVDQELEFTFDDLLGMELVEEHVTLSCVSNEVGGDLVGNARFLGVPITTLLEQAGVQPGATQVIGRSVDGWTGGFPTEYLYGPDRVALVAVAMNGEPLPIEHGFPVRLVVAGLYGYVSATKWLAEIELTGWDDFDGYWIPRGWSKLGPVKTQSRVDVPRANSDVSAGPQVVAGVAWAPDRGVTGVEVQISEIVDDEPVLGPWVEAELSADITDNSWRQWKLDWDAPPGIHVIRVRATDGAGETQPEPRIPVAPDGATGWHSIAVRVT